MFMNRVHEQCPKNLTQENTESNRAKNRSIVPSAQPKASPHAKLPSRAPAAQPALPRSRLLSLACQARACLSRPSAPRACLPRARAAGLLPARPAQAQRAQPRACRPSAPAPQLPASPSALLAHSAARPKSACAPSTPSRAPSCLVHCHNTKFCIVTQPFNQSLQYNPGISNCIATQFFLQHNPSCNIDQCIAIHF